MLCWLWGGGNTKKEESPIKQEDNNPIIDYKKKFEKLNKKYKDMLDSENVIKMAVEKFIEEQTILKFIIFSLTIQCGGSIELSEDSIKIAKEMELTHETEFLQENGTIKFIIKRKESCKT